jgi:hypothetical protein
VGGVTQSTFDIGGVDVQNFNKVALRYRENDFSIWINGIQQDTDTSLSSNHNVYGDVSLSSGTQYAVSIFAKAAEYDYLLIRGLGLGVSGGARFNISTGVVEGVAGYDSATIEDYGNGWYRCIAIGTATTITPPYYHMSPTPDFVAFAGNDSDGIYIWGAQCEAGSYATSYIPTLNGTAVTRLGETCNNATHSFPSEGVLYAEIAALANDGTFRMISISDGTASNLVRFYLSTSSDRIVSQVKVGGVTQSTFDIGGVNVQNFNKVALRYRENDFSIWINGTQQDTDTSGSVPSGLDELAFDDGNGGLPFYGKNKMVATFPYLSNDEMECLTGQGYGTFEALAAAYSYTIK